MEEKKFDSEFELVSPEDESIVNDSEITKEDFKLVDSSSRSHEQKFQTRPTTFLKDSLKRFAKNKSSLVASGILGILVMMAIIVPIVDRNEVGPNREDIKTEYRYLEPKLFDKNPLGFWDGTRKYNNISVDTSAKPDASTEEEKQEYWWPEKSLFNKVAITNKTFEDLQYANCKTDFGVGGYMEIGYANDSTDDYVEFYSTKMSVPFDISANTYISKFEVYDLDALKAYEGKYSNGVKGAGEVSAPDRYELHQCALYFSYTETDDPNSEVKFILLKDYASKHNVGGVADVGEVEEKINITDIIKTAAPTVTDFYNANISVRILNEEKGQNRCVLIKSLAFETESTNPEMQSQFVAASFTDASAEMREEYKEGTANYKYWEVNHHGKRELYYSQVVYCSFVYDTYEAVFGTFYKEGMPSTDLDNYQENGWIYWNVDPMSDPSSPSGWSVDPATFEFEILNPEKCPIAEVPTIDDFYIDSTQEVSLTIKVTYYKYYGLASMPRFLAGTDSAGNDMFKYVFAGLGISLALGVGTFVVCFLFGLAWGAISGYFGGAVDLVMERFTDILSGVPWIVVMTLAILKYGSNIGTFGLAICLTGWIGTASLTRTQFYRFRGREYVFASRTLGASSFRLIFRHILPNAMGTIITSSVLMIPSVIFSEATISFLGLGLKNVPSLGVILSSNQSQLLTNPYLLVFPSVIIALLMISFNLFGNGLRDAVNPSLKGEGE